MSIIDKKATVSSPSSSFPQEGVMADQEVLTILRELKEYIAPAKENGSEFDSLKEVISSFKHIDCHVNALKDFEMNQIRKIVEHIAEAFKGNTGKVNALLELYTETSGLAKASYSELLTKPFKAIDKYDVGLKQAMDYTKDIEKIGVKNAFYN